MSTVEQSIHLSETDQVNSPFPLMGVIDLYSEIPANHKYHPYADTLLRKLLPPPGLSNAFEQPLLERPQIDLDAGMHDVNNLNKAFCLGKTAITQGRELVTIVDLNKADVFNSRMSDFLAVMTRTSMKLVVAAAPSEGRADERIRAAISCLDIPVIGIDTTKVELLNVPVEFPQLSIAESSLPDLTF